MNPTMILNEQLNFASNTTYDSMLRSQTIKQTTDEITNLSRQSFSEPTVDSQPQAKNYHKTNVIASKTYMYNNYFMLYK